MQAQVFSLKMANIFHICVFWWFHINFWKNYSIHHDIGKGGNFILQKYYVLAYFHHIFIIFYYHHILSSYFMALFTAEQNLESAAKFLQRNKFSEFDVILLQAQRNCPWKTLISSWNFLLEENIYTNHKWGHHPHNLQVVTIITWPSPFTLHTHSGEKILNISEHFFRSIIRFPTLTNMWVFVWKFICANLFNVEGFKF